MKHFTLLLVALLSMVGLTANAATYVEDKTAGSGTHGEMNAADITAAIAQDGQVLIALHTVSNNCKDYYLAYDKTQTFSENTVLVIAPSSTNANVYTIKNLGTGQYFGTGNGTTSNALTSVTTTETAAATFTIADRTSGADVTPYNDGTYSLVSFVLSSVTSSTMYLNCNNADAHPKYFTGTGGYSLFCAYKVVEEAGTSADGTKTITSLASLNNKGVYVLNSARGAWYDVNGSIYQTNSADGTTVTGASYSYDLTNANMKWAIFKSDNDNYYLYNIGTQRFFVSTSDVATRYAKATTATSINNAGFRIVSNTSTDATYPWCLGMNGYFYASTTWAGQSWRIFQNNGDATVTGAGTTNATISTSDAGMKWQILSIESETLSDEMYNTISTAVTAYERALYSHDYTLSSAGMPSGATITVGGVEYTKVNAQGETTIPANTIDGTLSASDVKVSVGGGYVYTISVDNANYQVNVEFTSIFVPTESTTAEEKHQYLLKMPLAYVKHDGTNIAHTTTKASADKFIFIETAAKNGQYYIYDVTQSCYLYYVGTSNGSSVTTTSTSNVRFTTDINTANTWQFVAEDNEGNVDIIPGSVSDIESSTPGWNYTGGIANSCVLNLYSRSDSNGSWQVIDITAGSLPCAVKMFCLPGKEYMHKLVTNTGETVTSVEFDATLTNAGFTLNSDRANVGNKYKYVTGTAPMTEGVYTYNVITDNATSTTVTLTVSNFLQSPTPMMGWLTWNWFMNTITHDKLIAVAQGMKNKGLVDAGYKYIVIDDGWANNTTDKSALAVNTTKFPNNGMKGFTDAAKALGVKVGIYSDAGSMTCGNYQPGSYNYETTHVALFDSYGIDMLKYDFCNSEAGAYASYKAMGDAIASLNATRKTNNGTPFVFNACEWGTNSPWTWGAEAGASSWRATQDAREEWCGNHSRPGVLAGADEIRKLWMYAGVNRFNDADMMTIGLHGLGGPSNNTSTHQSNGGTITGLTDTQAQSQMSIWCMLASPLSLSCDLRDTPAAESNSVTLPSPLITEADLATLTNEKIISINQDALGQQAEYMEALSTGTTDYSTTGYDVYFKDLVGDKKAIAVVNRSGSTINDVSLTLSNLYISNGTHVCTDVWANTTSTVNGTLSTGTIAPYETKVYIIEDHKIAYTVSGGSVTYNGQTYAEGATIYANGEIAETAIDAVNTDTQYGTFSINKVDDFNYTITVTMHTKTTYTININAPAGETVTVWADGVEYNNGGQVVLNGAPAEGNLKATVLAGYAPLFTFNETEHTITLAYTELPQYGTGNYTLARLYPVQQDAEVGTANINVTNGNTYTLYNDVLAATFVNTGSHLYFGGCDAMNLMAGTDLFKVFFAANDSLSSSQMKMTEVTTKALGVETNATRGAEHYPGQQLEAKFQTVKDGKTLYITWRAILRDGSHYLRTEMVLTASADLQMYNVIPMIYDCNTTAAGCTPKVVGNTHGAVIISDKIFAGLETPTGHNSAGAGSDTNGYELATNGTSTQTWTTSTWSALANANIPSRINEIGYYSSVYTYSKSVSYTKGQRVITNFLYSSGNNRLVIVGVDLIDGNGDVVTYDYHKGYTGNDKSENDFILDIPSTNNFTIRYLVEFADENNTSTGTITTSVYNKKAEAISTASIVPLRGEWRRNAVLPANDNWKTGAVVGLIAQDADNSQRRRSFLAYSERERAVPYRAMPAYISWYELNIDRNNAAAPTYNGNMTSDQCVDVLQHWFNNFYNKYNIAPKAFVWDDGWDNYGTWTFNCNFPQGFTPVDNIARQMGSGIGAWLGPVGGYGTSGDYRRAYWTNLGQSMVLSNPNYYKVFKDAAYNLTKGQNYDFRFFKFDGISSAFTATGPSPDTDTGHENAEGIIRLERYVREELKSDIFFNTTVGTWASPFWFKYTDAVWRQQADYDVIGNNTIDREKWITYRDHLVYQNFVQNSPICPINTLMTHGFILSSHGAVSKNMDYDGIVREMRCAFACGSGMVELYNDYALMDDIANANGEKGMLWKELADCMKWQYANADVLMDTHWVGGHPWDGTNENIYGWASWNENKATFALRNGDSDYATKTYTTTLRDALNIPRSYTGNTVLLAKAFADQADLEGWPNTETAINIDTPLTLVLPKNTVYVFSTPIPVEAFNIEESTLNLKAGEIHHLTTSFTPADASNQNVTWTSSNEAVASVVNGVITAKTIGTAVITGTSVENAAATDQVTVNVEGDPNSYAVIVNGGVTGGGVTYGGVSYAGNSVVKTQEGFEKADFSSIAVFGYVGNITIDRTAKTITVTYTDDPALDIFSTVENPRWFQVKFITGSNCIADQNTGNSTTAVNLVTAASSKTAQAQQWQFIGDYNGFYMKSNLGNYVAYSGSRFTSLYIADDTNVASAQKLHLTKSGSGFEIQRYGVTATSVNQNGGTSAGVQLGDWAKGDTNNPLTFIPIEDTSIKFSTATNENYYLIKFCNSGLYMQDMGTGANVTTQSLARNDDSQYWKLVGTKDAFQLISKDGHYATYNGSRITTATTAPTSTFYLTTTTNTSYAGNYELGWSGVTTTQCYANQWGGTGAGTQLGLWTVGDVNNVIFFVDPTESSADEYEVEAGSRPTDIDDYSLWYDIPSTSTGVTDRWMEYALPMGNGQIGATLVGGVLVDEVQLNEKTLFEGTPTRSGNQGYYQNLGSIKVKDLSAAFSYAGDTTTPVKGYARYLDIVNGVAGVNYTSNDGNTQFKRHYFVSATDSVLVCDYEAVGDADLDILISLEADGQINASDVTYDETVATFRGSLSTVSYNARFDILTDGQKTEQANGIRVSGTKKATVIFSAITDYSTKSTTLKSGATATDLKNTVKRRIAAAKAKGYDALLADHTAKHSALMNRVKIDFGGASTMTTENLVKAYNQSTANKTNANGIFLEQLYFQYGRYMTIGANLDTSIHAPSNLQGIWNDRSNTSFWHCDIHADINVEMNYWPADPTNLSEMHLPFLEHIIDLSKEGFNWRTLAQAISGTSAPGWTVAVENNILGGTSTWENAHCKTLGAWYCSHLWRYYKYTCDKDFLIRALPVMYSAAEYLKYIATLDTDGTYVITEEFSPEHGNESTITAFAQQTAAELLSNILDADAELGAASPLTDAQVEEIRTFYNQFDKGLQVENYTWTRDGVTYTSQPCISEWKKISLTDPSHRHLSHLMCLFPYNQVSPYDADQTLFTAAKNGILARNGDVTGWSMGWQTNIYARCLQGDNARGYLSQALKHSTNYAIAMGGDGGCYYNLFDAHSPFQIDGNYGCTSGVAEMLLQSYDDVVTILPALPSAWATNGSAKGLKAVGNFIVDQTWENGKAKRVTIQSVAGSDLKVRMGEGSDLTGKDILVGGQKVTATKNADNTFSIPCEKGQKVEIYMDGITVVPGDVNANGEVSLSDLTTLIGIYRNTVSADGKYPDVDNNTEVTLDDITALVNIILGR